MATLNEKEEELVNGNGGIIEIVDKINEIPIDDSFQPKQLTTTDQDGQLIRKISATRLAELQEQASSPPSRSRTLSGINEHEGQDSKQHKGMPESKVLVLYTGVYPDMRGIIGPQSRGRRIVRDWGTIGMRTSIEDGVYAPEQHYLPKAIRDLPPLNDKDYVDRFYADAPLKPYCLPPVRGMKKRVVYWLVEYEPLLDSSDMTFDDWIRIAKDIRKSYSAYDGFVVLHGTDTLAYSACALSFMMENLGKPVVITGAQIPVCEVRSDGRENMIGALIVAGNLDIPEVTVLFNNKLLRGNRCTKIDNHGLEAFDSPNMAPLATMDISINVNYESIFRSTELRPFAVHEALCRNVVVLRIYPSIPIESVRAMLCPPTQGVVLQAYGSGNIPIRRGDILEEIKKAIHRGCLIVSVSQCSKGIMVADYKNGQILYNSGVIFGSDMTTEAALTKLAYVLAKQEWDQTTKAMMLRRNIAGELTVTRSEKLNELDIIPRLAKFLSITSSSETRMLRNALFPPLSCHAAFANDVQTLENLRLCGANLSGGDYNMRTPLHVAAAAGNAAAVEFLLRNGASVHIRDAADENALLCAVRSRNIQIIKMIRQAGGQLVLPKPRIGVELCLSVGSEDIDSLKAWHAADADISTPDYDGRTALHVAAGRGLEQICAFLCQNGANIRAKDHFGRTPIDEAIAGSEEGRVEDLIAPNFQQIFSLLGISKTQ